MNYPLLVQQISKTIVHFRKKLQKFANLFFKYFLWISDVVASSICGEYMLMKMYVKLMRCAVAYWLFGCKLISCTHHFNCEFFRYNNISSSAPYECFPLFKQIQNDHKNEKWNLPPYQESFTIVQETFLPNFTPSSSCVQFMHFLR